jgi:hypothetical protein
MKPIVFCLAALSLAAFGCAGTAHHASTLPTKSGTTTSPDDPQVIDSVTPVAGTPTEATSPESRKPGDFVVFNFEGSFYKNPLTLTERVIDRDAGSITIELSLAEKGKKVEVLRVRSSTTPERHGDVLGIEKATNTGSFATAKNEEYEAFMAKTMASADENESIVDSTDDVVTVRQTRIPVTKTRYRVKIGKQAATMSTLASQTFSWGDLGGEIKTDGGALVYRASLVDMGDAAGTVATLVAPTTAN